MILDPTRLAGAIMKQAGWGRDEDLKQHIIEEIIRAQARYEAGPASVSSWCWNHGRWAGLKWWRNEAAKPVCVGLTEDVAAAVDPGRQRTVTDHAGPVTDRVFCQDLVWLAELSPNEAAAVAVFAHHGSRLYQDLDTPAGWHEFTPTGRSTMKGRAFDRLRTVAATGERLSRNRHASAIADGDGRTTLTWDLVDRIRADWAAGTTRAEIWQGLLAEGLDIGKTAVNDAIVGRTWRPELDPRPERQRGVS